MADIIPHKHCSKCKREFPATSEHFHKDKKSKFGLSSQCKECAKQKAKDWHWSHREVANARSKARYLANPGEYRERNRRLIAEDPEYWREYFASYYQANKEKKLVQGRKWAEANREKSNAIKYEWRKRNPEFGRMVAKVRHDRNKKAAGSFSKEDIYNIFDEQDGRCAYCGIILSWSIKGDIHIDHIHPISRGGSNWPDNLCLACEHCNVSKNDKTVLEWQAVRGW